MTATYGVGTFGYGNYGAGDPQDFTGAATLVLSPFATLSTPQALVGSASLTLVVDDGLPALLIDLESVQGTAMLSFAASGSMTAQYGLIGTAALVIDPEDSEFGNLPIWNPDPGCPIAPWGPAGACNG